ncbi:GNAT family N-acetyltransferase [Blautia sp. HCP3S3_H10_1]|uniref:GNAT family N-acetyltransferase n=1 Tax=unclassified Blautia TaxID=2648079 RepID=UPI003F8EEBE4
MIRQYVDGDIDAVMQIWLNTNIQAHSFISPDYWQSNFDMVKEMLPLAEIYVHEVDSTNQIDGFIGLNNDYIEGIFVKEAAQSKGIGKQLLDYMKKVKSNLRLNVYKKNERAIQFYLREEFSIQSENVDDNTGEKEFIMVWNH